MIPSKKLSIPLVFLCLVTLPAVPVSADSAKKQGSAPAGAVLFRDKGCTYCHGTGAIGTKKAPALTELWKDKTWTNAKITSQILNGGQKMPPFSDSVTDDELTDLIAYLRAKKKPLPSPSDSSESAPTAQPQ